MKWLFKPSRKKVILTELNNVVREVGGEITYLDYSTKYFGNIILRFKKDGKEFKYVVDRDEIYDNKKMICNNSYTREEGKTAVQKLVEIILANHL